MKYLKLYENFELFDPKGVNTIDEAEWAIIKDAKNIILESQKELNPDIDLRIDYDLESTYANNIEVVMKLDVILVGINGSPLEESEQTKAFGGFMLIIQRDPKEYIEGNLWDGAPYHFTIIDKKSVFGRKEYISIHFPEKYTPKYTDYYSTEGGKYFGDFTWYFLDF